MVRTILGRASALPAFLGAAALIVPGVLATAGEIGRMFLSLIGG